MCGCKCQRIADSNQASNSNNNNNSGERAWCKRYFPNAWQPLFNKYIKRVIGAGNQLCRSSIQWNRTRKEWKQKIDSLLFLQWIELNVRRTYVLYSIMYGIDMCNQLEHYVRGLRRCQKNFARWPFDALQPYHIFNIRKCINI